MITGGDDDVLAVDNDRFEFDAELIGGGMSYDDVADFHHACSRETVYDARCGRLESDGGDAFQFRPGVEAYLGCVWLSSTLLLLLIACSLPVVGGTAPGVGRSVAECSTHLAILPTPDDPRHLRAHVEGRERTELGWQSRALCWSDGFALPETQLLVVRTAAGREHAVDPRAKGECLDCGGMLALPDWLVEADAGVKDADGVVVAAARQEGALVVPGQAAVVVLCQLA